jgi:hypothetical protein
MQVNKQSSRLPKGYRRVFYPISTVKDKRLFLDGNRPILFRLHRSTFVTLSYISFSQSSIINDDRHRSTMANPCRLISLKLADHEYHYKRTSKHQYNVCYYISINDVIASSNKFDSTTWRFCKSKWNESRASLVNWCRLCWHENNVQSI